jgi:hypothetical protein
MLTEFEIKELIYRLANLEPGISFTNCSLWKSKIYLF